MELKPIDCKRDERMEEKPKKNEQILLNSSMESRKEGEKRETEGERESELDRSFGLCKRMVDQSGVISRCVTVYNVYIVL